MIGMIREGGLVKSQDLFIYLGFVLYGEMAWQLWNKLFSLFGVSWVCPPHLVIFLSNRYCALVVITRKKGHFGKLQDLLLYSVYG